MVSASVPFSPPPCDFFPDKSFNNDRYRTAVERLERGLYDRQSFNGFCCRFLLLLGCKAEARERGLRSLTLCKSRYRFSDRDLSARVNVIR